VVALVGLLLGGFVPALVGTARPSAAADANASTLRLASQPAWTAAGQPLTMQLVVGGSRPASSLDLVVRIHRKVGVRSQFTLTTKGQSLGPAIVSPAPVAIASLQPDATGAFIFTQDLPTLDSGVYPVEVVIRDHTTGATTASLITYLIRSDGPVPEPLRVAWVQGIGAPPAAKDDPTFPLRAAQAAGMTQIVSALDGHPAMPVTLDVTPESAAAAAANRHDLATSLPKILTPSRALVSSPFVDVDATRLVDLGLGDELVDQRVEGDAVLTSLLGQSGDPRSWSSDTPLSSAAIGRLLTMGVSTVVVPEAGLAPLDRSATNGVTLENPVSMADTTGHTVDALVADAGLAAHFETEDPVLGAQQLLADLAVLYRDLPGTPRGVVIRPPADWAPDASLLNPVFDALTAAGSPATPVTVDRFVAEVPPLQDDHHRPVVRTTLPTGPANPLPDNSIDPAVALQIRAARAQLVGVRSLAGPTADLSLLNRDLLTAEANGLSRATRVADVTAVRNDAEAIRRGVHLVPGRTFRLTAREGTIPLTVVNENDFPVTVTLDVSSDKLEFVDAPASDRSHQQFQGLVLDPQQRLVVKVPVRARASAAFPLRADLHSPSGAVDLGRVQFTVVSTAFSGLGIALSVGAGLVLVWWWIRHWRRTRAATRAAAVRDRLGPDQPEDLLEGGEPAEGRDPATVLEAAPPQPGVVPVADAPRPEEQDAVLPPVVEVDPDPPTTTPDPEPLPRAR
jgi:hypothetical protein